MGTQFTPDATRRIADVVRRVERTPRSLTGRRPRRALPPVSEAVSVKNMEAALDIPAGGVISLYGWDTTNYHYGGLQPSTVGLTELAIAAAEIKQVAENESGLGSAWISGVRRVLASAYADLSFGDRMGTQANSFYALANVNGPLRMLGDVPADEQPEGLPEGVGFVRAGFFNPGVEYIQFAGAATLDLDGETVSSRTHWDAQRTWTNPTTSSENQRGLLQFPEAMRLGVGESLSVFIITLTGTPHFVIDAVPTGVSGFFWTGATIPELAIAPILESFDCENDSYTTLRDLSSGAGLTVLRFAFKLQAAPVASSFRYWAHVILGAVGADQELYGLRVSFPHVDLNEASTGGVLSVYYPLAASEAYYVIGA